MIDEYYLVILSYLLVNWMVEFYYEVFRRINERIVVCGIRRIIKLDIIDLFFIIFVINYMFYNVLNRYC